MHNENISQITQDIFREVNSILQVENTQLIVDTNERLNCGSDTLEHISDGALAYTVLLSGKNHIYISTKDIRKGFMEQGAKIFIHNEMWYRPCDLKTGIATLAIHEFTHCMESDRNNILVPTFQEFVVSMNRLYKELPRDKNKDASKKMEEWKEQHRTFWDIYNMNVIRCKDIIKKYEYQVAEREKRYCKWVFE